MKKFVRQFRELEDVFAGEADENYTIQTAIVGTDLTISLKTLNGVDASLVRPIFIRVNNTLMKITTALSVTITAAMADIFAWDAGKIQGNDSQLFVYLINNNGAPQIGVSPCPTLATVATNYYDAGGIQVGAAGHINMVMSGVRNAINTCSVIGRVNVQQTDANPWTAPLISRVINRPIYETDELVWTPNYVGFAVIPTALSVYVVQGDFYFFGHREYIAGTSNDTVLTVTLPIKTYTMANMYWQGPAFSMTDNGVSQAGVIGHAIIPSGQQNLNIQKTPGNPNSWTGVNGKAATVSNMRCRVS